MMKVVYLMLMILLLTSLVDAYSDSGNNKDTLVYLGSGTTENSYVYSLTPFSYVEVTQTSIDDIFPSRWDSKSVCIIAEEDYINFKSLGLSKKDLLDVIQNDGFIEGTLDEVKVVMNARGSDLKWSEFSEVTETGFPLEQNSEKLISWDNFSEDFIYCPLLVEGEIKFGFNTNTYEIKTFTGGTDAKTLTDGIRGIEPSNIASSFNRTNLVLEMLFADGLFVNDTSIYGNNATRGIASQQFERMIVNGSNTGFALPQSSVYSTDLQSNFSINMWYFARNTSDPSSDLIGFNGSLQDQNFEFTHDQMGNQIQLFIKDTQNTGAYINSSCTLNIESWNDVGVSFVQGANAILFVNGKVCNTTSDNTSVLFTPKLKGIYIGSANITNLFVNGSIDNVLIWNRTITVEEHNALYGQGVHFNGTTNNSNWTSPIFSQSAGSFDRWINITVDYDNESDRDIIGTQYRTGSIVRPEQNSNLSPYIVSGYDFNNSVVNGDNTTWINDTWSKNNLICRTVLDQVCPSTIYGAFDNENSTNLDNNYTAGVWIVNYSANSLTGTTRINMSTNWTEMAWVYATANQTGANEAHYIYEFGRHLGPGTNNLWGGHGIYRSVGGTNSLNHKVTLCHYSVLTNGTILSRCTTPRYSENEWHHVASTFNDSKFCLIVDGYIAGCKATYGFEVNMSWPQGTFSGVNIMPCIGALSGLCNGSSSNHFEGRIDDLYILNKSIVDTDIINWGSYSALVNRPNGTSVSSGRDNIFLQLRFSLQTANSTNLLRILGFNITSNYKPVQAEARAQYPSQSETSANPRIICTSSNCPASGNITAYNGTVSDNDNDTIKIIYSWEYTPSGASSAIPFDIVNIPIEGNDSNTVGNNYAKDVKFTCTCRGDHQTDCFKPNDGYDGWGAYWFNSSSESCSMSFNQSSLQGYHYNLTNEFTMTARIKKVLIDRPSSFASIVRIKQSNDSVAAGIEANNNTQFRCRFDTSNATATVCPAIGNLSDLQWHFVALRYKLGFNNSNATLDVDMNNSATVHISGIINSAVNGSVKFISGDKDALVDDVHVYTKYLTDEQLFLIMDNQTNTIHSSMLTPGDVWTVKMVSNDRYQLGNSVNMSVVINGNNPLTSYVSISWEALSNLVSNVTSYFVLLFDDNSTSHRDSLYSSTFTENMSSGVSYNQSNPFMEFESAKDAESGFGGFGGFGGGL